MKVCRTVLTVMVTLYTACGTARTAADSDARPAGDGDAEEARCPVHVVNASPYRLMLRLYVRGVRGITPIGSIERDGVLRFSTLCARDTVRIAGYRPSDEGEEYAAYGYAPLVAGEVTRVEMRRISRYSEPPDGLRVRPGGWGADRPPAVPGGPSPSRQPVIPAGGTSR